MTVATVITPPTIRSAAAPHPARWTLRSATMAMLVLALALLAAGAVTDAFAQPPSPPPISASIVDHRLPDMFATGAPVAGMDQSTYEYRGKQPPSQEKIHSSVWIRPERARGAP